MPRRASSRFLPPTLNLPLPPGSRRLGSAAIPTILHKRKKIEQVSTWQGMNLERIVALKPDLVIAWRGGNAERQVDQLASLGIKVMWVDATSIEQIANALRQLAPGVRNRIRPNKPRNPCWISTRN